MLISTSVLWDSPEGYIHYSNFYKDSLGFYPSTEYLLNFLWNLYIPPWLGKTLKFTVYRYLKNAFVGQKIESRYFYSGHPRQNNSQGSSSSPPGRVDLRISPRQNIYENLFSPGRKEMGKKIKWYQSANPHPCCPFPT